MSLLSVSSLSVRHVVLPIPLCVVLGLQDIDDLQNFGLTHGVDYIAASFVRKPEDIDTIRMVLGEEGAHIKVCPFCPSKIVGVSTCQSPYPANMRGFALVFISVFVSLARARLDSSSPNFLTGHGEPLHASPVPGLRPLCFLVVNFASDSDSFRSDARHSFFQKINDLE